MITSESRDFEYDEGSDEADEAFEAADEGSDEAFEAADEGSDEADEAFEAADEGSDEADEAFEAADEGSDEGSDESIRAEGMDGEALSANARLSAKLAQDRDREQRRTWAAQLASDRRREAQAANATQQSLTTRLRGIRGSGRTRTMTVGSLNGVRVVKLTLANGRTASAQVVPPLASSHEVNRLRGVLNVNERRRAASDAANSRAIGRLAAAQAIFAKQQTAQQVKSDKELGQRIVQSNTQLNKRITTELANQKSNVGKHDKRIFRRIRKMRRQMLMDNVLITSQLPFFAAYGVRTNPFAGRNMALTGILAGGLVGDNLIGLAAGGKPSKAIDGISSTWSYLAPVAVGLTDFLLFRNKQHERFVTGVTTIAKGSQSVDGLLVPIAKGSASTFAALTDTPVVATVVGGKAQDVLATVAGGKLSLTLSAKDETNDVKIAWVVDTNPGASVITNAATA